MRVICSYCRKDMGTKPPLDDESLSHAICPGCFEYFQRQWEGLSLGEYLDAIDSPAMVVNGDGRIMAANQMMANMLGKSDRDLFGLLGGEAMECAYARLPGGCGKTTHCPTCTIRQTLLRALETGEPQMRVPAHLDRDDGRMALTISAWKRDGVVTVRIDDTAAKPSADQDLTARVGRRPEGRRTP